MTPVVRVGDTVRRAAGPWTPTIHALLRHVRAAGFEAVPEPLGIDEQGREILSLLPGRVATYPLDEFVLAERTLARAARTLRAYHDAMLGFVAHPEAAWQWPAHEPAEVICHNDFAPYNLMVEGEDLTGVIDFDLASPGPRVLDMGYAAYRFVPLTDPANPDVPHPGAAAQAPRLEAFCAAYGDERVDPRAVTDAAIGSSASSSISSFAAPPRATPPSRSSWNAVTSRSTSATSPASSGRRPPSRRPQRFAGAPILASAKRRQPGVTGR